MNFIIFLYYIIYFCIYFGDEALFLNFGALALHLLHSRRGVFGCHSLRIAVKLRELSYQPTERILNCFVSKEIVSNVILRCLGPVHIRPKIKRGQTRPYAYITLAQPT